MADKRKYVSEFEIQSNVDEALKQLQKYYVEFSKMPSAIDDFNKSLKKNAQLEKHFYDMMSAIPKTMKKLSEFSKLKLIPKKELENLSNTVQLIESAAKGMGSFSSSNISSLVSEFSKVSSELEQMEKSHSKVVEKSEVYNNLLAKASNLQKTLVGSADKFKNSTGDLADNYTKVKRKLTTITNELKNAPSEGVLSAPYIEKASNKLDDVQQQISSMGNSYDDITSTIGDMSKKFDDVLSSSNDISGSMKNSIAKASFQKVIDEIVKAKDEYELLIDDNLMQSKLSSVVNDRLSSINERLDSQISKMHEISDIESRLIADTKTRNDAISTMNRLTGTILEEMSEIDQWNSSIKTQFEEQAKVIGTIRNELESLILNDEADNEVIKKKIGLLKTEGDKLSFIINQQQDIKKLELQSISATVKRAREQNSINKAYIKETLSKKKNLAGYVDAFKVWKSNIPNKAMATFGTNGVVAAKAMSGAFKMLGAVIAPLSGMLSVLGAIKMAFELEKQIKGGRKQILMLAANTNTAGDAFEKMRGGEQLAETGIEKMRQQTERWAWSLGVAMDQAIGYLGDFSKAGFKTTSSLRSLEDFMGIAPTLGMEVGELASSAGNLRAEFGMSLSGIGSSFVQLQKNAKTAGITTSIFFDKVINAATGLGLYGKRIDEVSNLFSGLVKNMKLPEAAATSAAGKIVGSFKDLSNEAQITIYRLGNGAKFWERSYKQTSQKNQAEIDDLISKENDLQKAISGTKDGEIKKAKIAELSELRNQRAMIQSRQQMLDNTNTLKGVNGELEKGLAQNPAQQFLMQMSFLTKKFAGGIDVTGPIQGVKDAIENNILKMKIGGENFGMDREVVETMRSLASNLASNSQGLKQAFGADEAKGMLGVLSSSNSAAERQAKLTAIFGKKDNTYLKGVQQKLKDGFPGLATELTELDNASDIELQTGLAKVVSSLDVNFAAMTDAQKKIQIESAKREAKVAGLEALKQTRSTEDALNNQVSVWLRKIFTTLEKLVTIFSVLWSGKLKEIESANSAMTKNQETASALQAKIQKKQADLEIESVNATPERQTQIEAEQANLKKASDSISKYSESLESQRSELNKSGKITEAYTNIARTSGALGKVALESAGALSEGMKFQTTGQARTTEFHPTGMGSSYSTSSVEKFASGGVVGGSSFLGDKILAGLNSGEMVLPKKAWQNMSSGGGGQNVNDNRVINIYVNQNDRRQVEQIVLNALYTDKLK